MQVREKLCYKIILMISISFIIPSFNSPSSTIKTINSIEKSFTKLSVKYKYDVIIVDDYSSIKNSKIMELNCKKIKNKNKVKIIKNKKNLGFALSCLVGVKKSKNDYVKIMHAGDIEKSKDLRKYLLLINKDLILLTYPHENCKRSIIRKIISKICSKIIKFFSGIKFDYFQSPILCKRLDFLKFFPANYGNFFLSLIIIKMIYKKKRYIRFPVKYNYKKGSTAISFKNLFSLFSGIIMIIYWRYKIN